MICSAQTTARSHSSKQELSSGQCTATTHCKQQPETVHRVALNNGTQPKNCTHGAKGCAVSSNALKQGVSSIGAGELKGASH